MRHRFILILLLACLAGCERSAPPAPAAQRMKEREQRARELVSQPPRVTRHATSAGEVIVIEVPVALPHGLVDTQHCFVWRDQEYKTATVSCPASIETATP